LIEPDPHAEPLDTSIPSRSNSAKRISLLLPGKEVLTTPGTCFLG